MLGSVRQQQTIDERLMQGCNVTIVVDQWTAEEVENHMAAESTIKKEQEQARGEILSAPLFWSQAHWP